MPRITLSYGALLILLGCGAYFATGRSSVTALIPAFFGVPILLAGWMARKEKWLKHAMHLAATLGLLGFLGTVSSLPKLFAWLGGGTVDRPAAVIVQGAMALLSAVFVFLCIRSFIQARRAREQD